MGDEISVDLRLALKKLKDDIADAKSMIQKGLSKSLNLGTTGSDPERAVKGLGAGVDNLNTKVRRVSASLKEQISEWKKLNAGGVAPGQKVTILGQTPGRGPSGPGAVIRMSGSGLATGAPYFGATPPPWRVPPIMAGGGGGGLPAIPKGDMAKFWRNMMLGAGPIMNPTSMFGNMFAGRQMFKAFSTTTTGARAMGTAGLAGTGGAAVATGGLLVALIAVGVALRAMKAALDSTVRAIESGRQLYGKSLTTGLGMGFLARRGNLASVLGVGEDQVNHFGAAIATLGPRLNWASGIMAKTAPSLASVGFEFGILHQNLQALFFQLGRDAAPTIRKVVAALSEAVKGFANLYQHLKPFMALGAVVANGAIGDVLVKSLINSLASGTLTRDTGAAGQPTPFMKQMPASSLERMGLVVGGAVGGRNHAAETSHNTAQTVQLLKLLINKQNQGYRSGHPFAPSHSYP